MNSNLPATMQQYTISQAGIKQILRQSLTRTLPIMITALAVGFSMSAVNSKEKTVDMNLYLIFFSIFAFALCLSSYRNMKRQKKLLESYMLSIGSNLITREQFDTPTISMYHTDIREIVKNKNGSFTIRGKGRGDLIGIPTQIDDYARVEEKINQIKPVSTKVTGSLLQKYPRVFSLLTVGLMLCVLTLSNKIIVGLSGIILVGIMLLNFYEIRSNKNIDEKTKSSMWILPLIVAFVIVAMILKLLGIK